MKLLIITLTILMAVWAFFIEPNIINIKKYRIEDKELAGIKAVFIGDLHIKTFQHKKLKRIVNIINKLNPDIILSVGDYSSGHKEKATLPIEIISDELSKAKTNYGFYTVLGNHDIWINKEKASQVFTNKGIIVLENENTYFQINNKKVYIAGVEDLQTKNPDIQKALKNTHNPVILLSHSPDIFPDIPSSVNLTLAGHVHGGQIRIPFIGAVIVPSKYGNKYSQGLIIENNKKLLVTKGIGTSIIPVRFNCIPEIVVIEFN